MARLFEHDESTVRERAGKPRMSRPSPSVTPIPRRASASSPGAVRVRTRYTSVSTEMQDDVTRLPTVPPSAIWQDEDDIYGIESHLAPVAVHEYSPFLPSSPLIDELDTLPPALKPRHNEGPRVRITGAEALQPGNIQFPIEIAEPSLDQGKGQAKRHAQLVGVVKERADICEQATNPPPVPFRPHAALALHDEPSYIDAVVEADTVMDDTLNGALSLPDDIDMYPTQLEDVVDVALTLRARELLRHKGSQEDKPAFLHDPLDYIRWWLLYPNRLEFLCWLGGAMLLGIGLCIVLMVTGLGLGWMSFGHLTH